MHAVRCRPGAAPPFRSRLPWWQDAASLAEPVRGRYKDVLAMLQLLEASLPSEPVGAVTRLSEIEGGRSETTPVAINGPSRDLAWTARALQGLRLKTRTAGR
jgi:hypothetical protein